MSSGKGFWIWQVGQVEGGNVERAVNRAVEAGLGHVCVKIADANYRYNYDYNTKTDYAGRLIGAFLDAGIEVWAWQYVYLSRPDQEAEVVINYLKELPSGISRFIVNAEKESKGRGLQATTYMAALKKGVNIPVGLSSYRYPKTHHDFPWSNFGKYIDFNIPQIYWMHGTDPAGQLRRSMSEFKDIYPNIPYIPTGAAFREHGWQPTPKEIHEFLDECKKQGFDTVNFWEWANARTYGLWAPVRDYNWSGALIPPPPPSQAMFRARCIVGALNVRSGPSAGHRVVRTISFGTIVEVFEVSSTNWYRIGNDEWCSGAASLMQKIDESNPPLTPTPPLTKLYYPLDQRWPISQRFGERPNTYTISRGHNGVDWAVPVGNPIYAAADGIVEVAKEQTNGYGRHLRIRHSHGLTIYGHLSKMSVKVGDRVNAKQVIGLSGGAKTDPYAGMSTGPHLHFEYRWDIPAPQVPGGYVYNAVDVLPLLVSHEEGDPLFEARCIVDGLNVRSGPGTSYSVYGSISRGTVVNVYETSGNLWYRIGIGRWCSGLPQFMEKIGTPSPTPEPPTPVPTPDPVPTPELPKEFGEMKVTAFALNIRSGPGMAHPVVGSLKRNDDAQIQDISGSDAWIKIGENQWIAVEIGNTRFATMK